MDFQVNLKTNNLSFTEKNEKTNMKINKKLSQ